MPRGRPKSGKRKRNPNRATRAEKKAGLKYAKPRVKKPSKTFSHTKAGLHRVGRSGNRYVDRKGRVFHRGKGGTFALGASKVKRSTSSASSKSKTMMKATPLRTRKIKATIPKLKKPKPYKIRTKPPRPSATKRKNTTNKVRRKSQSRGVWH